MKRIHLILLLSFATQILYAQSTQILSSPNSFENRIDSVFMNVNIDEVENGILHEHGFPFVKFLDFQGTVSDHSTTKMDFSFL